MMESNWSKQIGRLFMYRKKNSKGPPGIEPCRTPEKLLLSQFLSCFTLLCILSIILDTCETRKDLSF